MIIDVKKEEGGKKVDSLMLSKFIESRIHEERIDEDLFRVGKCLMNIKSVKLGVTEIE